MDRRDNPEAAGGPSDEQLQKALSVIIQSYQGMSPEKLYREAIHCFDSLIDISHNTEAIREFAQKKEIDLKYLVDGANFVISKMHFNSENNYYVTLGIPRSATAQEIRERWKRLMLLYHPDRQKGQEEWVSERAKKVNEAYSMLKDEARRLIYDKRRGDNAAGLHAAQHTPSGGKKSGSPHRMHRSTGPEWTKMRKYLPRMLVVVYIVVAVTSIGIIYLRNRSSDFESELIAKQQRSSGEADHRPVSPGPPDPPGLSVKDSAATAVPETQHPVTAVPEQAAPGQAKEKIIAEKHSRPVSVSSGSKKITPGTKPQTLREHEAPASPAQEPDRESRPPAKTDKHPEKRLVDLLKSPVPMHSSAPKHAGDGRVPVPEPTEAERKTTASAAGQRPPVRDLPQEEQEPSGIESVADSAAGQMPLSPARSDTVTKDEVEGFIQRYIGAYEKNDLETFMVLFSRSAVENDSMDYGAIQSAYRETFSEKINYYKLSDIEISLAGINAFVSGRYSINRYLSRENRWVRYSGKIRWVLARENSSLKIIRINYDK